MLISPSGLSKVKDSVKKIFFGHQCRVNRNLNRLLRSRHLGTGSPSHQLFLKMNSLSQLRCLLCLALLLPWIIKPVFGFMSDGLPLFGYRRRPYLVLSGLLGAISWVSLATVVHTPMAATVAIALGLSVAISDVIVDSLVVERARAESQVRQAHCNRFAGCFICWKLDNRLLCGLLLEHTTHGILDYRLFPLILSGCLVDCRVTSECTL